VNQKERVKKIWRTGKWAETMTKWLITYCSKGNKRWQITSFRGSKGQESSGIVDLIAIRKDHRKLVKRPLKKGDLFKIVLIQVKGGTSPVPSNEDNKRLAEVKKYHRAKYVILAHRKKEGKLPVFKSLARNLKWEQVKPEEIFK
jgi:hypothetical protein